MKKTTNEIRQDFLKFFEEKEHIILSSSSLVPSHDSTLLFTNAGMNQFKEIFLGQKKINHPRITTVQRCLRTGGKHNDLENVGYTSKHHTFFEMLGNFSFNDYFKKEAIEYAWELLTSKKWFSIPKNRLWISVYQYDEESYKIWNEIIKIPTKRIIKIGNKNNSQYESDNFWQMGDTGPCGPCTEIFYYYGDEIINDSSEFLKNENKNFVEIWNIVFIEFNRISKTKIVPLSQKSIDTGMGLERISAVLQNVYSNYNIDIFQKLIEDISYFSPIKDLNHPSFKVIADHIRSSSYIIADDVTPSNEHRGYVLRRIIRRALRHGNKIGIKKIFLYKLVSSLIEVMGQTGNILKNKKEKIEKILQTEEIQFSYTLDKGLKILNNEIKKTKNNILSGESVFYLYDTFGFPFDLTEDVCKEKNIKIDYKGYQIAKEKQKKQSNINNKFYKNYNDNIIIDDTCIFQGYKKYKTKALIKNIFLKNKFVSSIIKNEKSVIFLDTTPFYAESGGQIGDIGKLYNKKSCFIVEKTKKYGKNIGHIGYLISGKMSTNDSILSEINQNHRHLIQINHTATHLLHTALKTILGENTVQKGSLVTDKYLRFDFSYSKSIQLSQIHEIENLINMKIRDNILIKIKELSLSEAKKSKAIALFDNQYRSVVRVVFIDNFSIELCGGTHTKRTGNIGFFKIISQLSVASGIKRIEAITGQEAIDYLHKKDSNIQDISHTLNCSHLDIKEQIKKLIVKIKNSDEIIHQLQKKEYIYQIKKLIRNTDDIKGIKFLINKFQDHHHKLLRKMMDELKTELKHAIIILINIKNNNFTIIIGVTKSLIHQITATKIMNIIIKKTNGKGGGKKEIAEGGGFSVKKIPLILNNVKSWIKIELKNKN